MNVTERVRIDVLVVISAWSALAAVTASGVLGVYGPTGQLEVAAVIAIAWSVWLAAKNSLWNWPVGIVGTALYLVFFWDLELFADAGLQVVYIGLGFVGLVAWSRRDAQPERAEAQRASWTELGVVLAAVVIGTVVVRAYLLEVGGSAPFWDAVLTSGSLGAQYLLIRKYIENWYLWAVVDVAYVGLFIDRAAYLTAALYVLLLAMVIKAAIEWRTLLPAAERA